MTLTGAQANFLLDIAMATVAAGVPVPYPKSKDAVAKQCEKAGLVERHYVTATRFGAILTDNSQSVIDLFKAN